MKYKHLFTGLSVVIAAGCTATSPSPSTAPSWWGGEIHANQTFGYGIYEATLTPSTGQGSITGFFNLCYSDPGHIKCIQYSTNNSDHLELDMEFTPAAQT